MKSSVYSLGKHITGNCSKGPQFLESVLLEVWMHSDTLHLFLSHVPSLFSFHSHPCPRGSLCPLRLEAGTALQPCHRHFAVHIFLT